MTKAEPIELQALATTMRRVIYNAYRATFGSNTDAMRAYQARANQPRIGDLVIEATTIDRMRHEGGTDLDGIGHLEEIAWELVGLSDPDFAWDEAKDGPRPKEEIFYLRTLDGRRFRWTDAQIIAAVTDMDF